MKTWCPGIVVLMIALLLGGCAPTGTMTREERFDSKILYTTRLYPLSDHDKRYLEISPESNSVLISSIDADILIIDFFNMYCTKCQALAPDINRLYSLAQSSSKKIKFIGYGAGNTALEVSVYANKYDVQFPVFPDPTLEISQSFGAWTMPHIVVAKRLNNGNFEIVYNSAGGIGSARSFLSRIERM